MKILILFIFIMSVFGCGTIKTPERHYYRLSELDKENNIFKNKNSIAMSVANFEVVGLLNNRNLIYVNSDKPQELMQFNFHFWHESLSKVITRQFLDYLKNVSDKNTITNYTYAKGKGYILKPRIDVMEIHYKKDSAEPVLKVSFRLYNDKGKIVLDKKYVSKKVLKNKEIYHIVTEYNTLLLNLYKEFMSDMNSLKLNM